jgi:hypothetical protein
MGQWAVSGGVQAIRAAQAAMTTRPSRILLHFLSNASSHSQATSSYTGKRLSGRSFSCHRPHALGG